MSDQAAVAVSHLEFLPTKPLGAWDICVGVIPAIACLPLMIGQGIQLWNAAQTKVGLIIWLIIAAIVAVRARGHVTRHAARMWAAILLYALATVALGYGLLTWSFNWGQLATSLFLVAWGLGRCSQRRWHETVGWGSLLLITIPLNVVYQSLDDWLTEVAAGLVSLSLESHGVLHHLDGLILALEFGSFSVAATTSAKLGLYAVVCTTVLWCWVWSRSLFHNVALVLCSVLALALARSAAILAVCFGLIRYQQDWTLSGNPHYLIGILSFALVIVLMAMLDQALRWMVAPIPSTHPEHFTLFAAANNFLSWPKSHQSEEIEDEIVELQAVRQKIEQWRLSWYCVDWKNNRLIKLMVYMLAVVCGLSILPTTFAAIRGGIVQWAAEPAKLRLEPLEKQVSAQLLPADIGEFRQSAFQMGPANPEAKSATGMLDARWIYQWQGFIIQVDLTAPHAAWSPPFFSQKSTKITSTVTFKEDDEWPWYDGRQTNAFGGEVYVLQCCLTEDLTPPRPDIAKADTWPLLDKLQGLGKATPSRLYEIRVSCETGNALQLKQLEQLQEFFEAIRKQFRTSLPAGQLSPNIVQATR